MDNDERYPQAKMWYGAAEYMAKVDKEKFDALLKRMLQAKPTPKSTIETSRKRKIGKIIAPPTVNQGK